jgi:hypothetical protein
MIRNCTKSVFETIHKIINDGVVISADWALTPYTNGKPLDIENGGG